MGKTTEICGSCDNECVSCKTFPLLTSKAKQTRLLKKDIKAIGKQNTLWSAKQYTTEKYTHDINIKDSIIKYLVRYKESDIRKGFYDNDLSYDWFYENIYIQPCKYCGTTEHNIGADRIDNLKGHSKENVVPCCALCNITRADRFSVNEMMLLGETIAKIRQNRLCVDKLSV